MTSRRGLRGASGVDGITFEQIDKREGGMGGWLSNLNVPPSRQAVARRRAKLRKDISTSRSHTPLPQIVERLNGSLEGARQLFRLSA